MSLPPLRLRRVPAGTLHPAHGGVKPGVVLHRRIVSRHRARYHAVDPICGDRNDAQAAVASDAVAAYQRDGYYSPVRVMSADGRAATTATRSRRTRPQAGKPLQGNWRHKTHLLFTWADELVHHPKIVDAVEDVIGPDILCWTTNFFIKEAANPGLRLLAPGLDLLGPRAARRDHRLGRVHAQRPRQRLHEGDPRHAPDRPAAARRHLPQGQPALARPGDRRRRRRSRRRCRSCSSPARCRCTTSSSCTAPSRTARTTGASASRSATSRPTCSQIKVRDSATLVRGVDHYDHFDHEPRPKADLDEAALAAHADAVGRQVKALYQGTDKTAFRA